MGKNYYFTQETEDAIIRYNKLDEEDDTLKRSRIYEEEIKYPFEKIAENVMNTFKFSYFDVPKKDVQKRVVSHMIEKIHMFDETKGSKAFSYFSTIAKYYLIHLNNKNYDRYQKHSSMDNEDTYIEAEETYDMQENYEQQEFFDSMIEYWRSNITSMFSKERDIKIATAILELFEKRENIETFNKKALYVMIREMTGVERTQHITKVVKKFRSEYYDLAENYAATGMINPTRKHKKMFNVK